MSQQWVHYTYATVLINFYKTEYTHKVQW